MDINNNIDLDKLYIEIIYYLDNLPTIKSYYIMSNDEYNNLITIYMDIYIENFINNEVLSKDKLDIHIIKNLDNIHIINNFLNIYGNPFDILNYIYSKKSFINIHDKEINSDSSPRSDLNEIIIKKPKIIVDNYNNDDDNNILDIVDTVSDLINSFNKSNKIDNNKLIELSKTHPEILNDDIIKEFL